MKETIITREISPKKSFYGFSWKRFLLGFKKPALMIIGVALTALATFLAGVPALAGVSSSVILELGGIPVISERIWAAFEFWFKEVELK